VESKIEYLSRQIDELKMHMTNKDIKIKKQKEEIDKLSQKDEINTRNIELFQ